MAPAPTEAPGSNTESTTVAPAATWTSVTDDAVLDDGAPASTTAVAATASHRSVTALAVEQVEVGRAVEVGTPASIQ